MHPSEIQINTHEVSVITYICQTEMSNSVTSGVSNALCCFTGSTGTSNPGLEVNRGEFGLFVVLEQTKVKISGLPSCGLGKHRG